MAPLQSLWVISIKTFQRVQQHVTQETTEKRTLINYLYISTTQFDVGCAVIATYFRDHEKEVDKKSLSD